MVVSVAEMGCRPRSGWPNWVGTATYESASYPRADAHPISLGANCQPYAYAFLALFDRSVPSRRSSELWSDLNFDHPARPNQI